LCFDLRLAEKEFQNKTQNLITSSILNALLLHSGSSLKRKKQIHMSQLRISYVLAFVYKLSFFEIAELTKIQVHNLIYKSDLSNDFESSENRHKLYLLDLIKDDFYLLFNPEDDTQTMKLELKFTRNFTSFINKDLRMTVKLLGFKEEITTKSFYI
jgi:hypothetical protein